MLRSRVLPLLLLRLLTLPRLARFDGGTPAGGCGLGGSERSNVDATDSLDFLPSDAAVILVLLVVRFLGRISSCITTPSLKALVGIGRSEEG